MSGKTFSAFQAIAKSREAVEAARFALAQLQKRQAETQAVIEKSRRALAATRPNPP